MINQWQNYLNNDCKIVATISAKNNQNSIYECIKKALPHFEAVFVIDNGSSDDTQKEIYKFIRRERNKNLFIFDYSHNKHWQNLPESEILNLSRMKANEFIATTTINVPHLWVSLRPNVLLSQNTRELILENCFNWTRPELNHNFYRTTKGNWTVSVTFKQGKLMVGPDSANPIEPCFYLKNEENILKTKFDESQHSSIIIGEEV